MARIAWLGLGAMGSRMARNLLAAGHTVTVWNRTPSACASLVEAGARPAASPREAARGAEFVIGMLRDDNASRQVWLEADTGAAGGMEPTALAIECGTLSVKGILDLGAKLAEQGVELVEAPVSGTLPQADGAQLIFLLGGDAAALERATPVLRAMGDRLHHVGALGHGAWAKLVVNTLLGAQATLLAELLGGLRRGGADAARVLEVASATAVWSPILTRHAKAMLENDFAPQFPVQLIEKDLDYTLAAVGGPAVAPTLAAAAAQFRQARLAGWGDENHTAVAKLFAPPATETEEEA